MNININTSQLKYVDRVLLYAKYRQDSFNFQAVFSDETENYKRPLEPKKGERVNIRLRTSRNNPDSVELVWNDQILKMQLQENEDIFSYYQVLTPPVYKKATYYFKIYKNGKCYYYTKKGISFTPEPDYMFQVLPGFQTPQWAKGAVMYQIFVDRFYNGDPTNDVEDLEYKYLGRPSKKVTDWNQLPETDDIRNFYGGDLKGIMDKMNYLRNLGVDVIYLTPIFVSPSNHKYDAQDYDYVDPHFGVIIEDGGEPLSFEKFSNRYASMYIQRTTDKRNLEASNQLFIKLVEVAHQAGIKIILDGVFNHCGAFNKWLDREGIYNQMGYPVGAYREKNSIYHSFFKWYELNNWPNNDAYDGWWGYDNHPKLNYEGSPELYRYILEVGKKWVSPPYNADGWRLDVAADLGYSSEMNHQFWRDFRNAVKRANPNAIILAEHYGDPAPWLAGDEWDTIMNYNAFMEPITWFLTGMEKHSEEYRGDLLCNSKAFEDAMRYHMARFSIQSLQVSMNELSNHDHSRFLTRTNMAVGRLHTVGPEKAEENINKGIMKEAITFQMTWPGAPTIYYGDEAGVCGWTDPDNRRTYPWGKEDREILSYYQALIQIHKRYPALKYGSLEFLDTSFGTLGYGRWDIHEKIVVVLNNLDHVKEVVLPVWRIGVSLNGAMKTIIVSSRTGHGTNAEYYQVREGLLKIHMPPFSSCILLETEK